MIKKVHIQALKSIKDLTVKCKKLNLIVGTNSSGKSTFLQGLLLEAQNSAEQWGLNGPLVELGEFNEAHNYFANRDAPIKIETWTTRESPFVLEFKQDHTKKNGYNISMTSSESNEIELPLGLHERTYSSPIMYGVGIHYLSSRRIGVQDSYMKNRTRSDYFGVNGEFSIAYLHEHEDDILEAELLKDIEHFGDSLSGQINYWLSMILGNTMMKTRSVAKTNFVQILYNNNPQLANQEDLFCRPINIGSGISYLISILIECLASDKTDILIIENPEIHLHPKAQAELCKFFYFVSQTGRQLFIETHSDHIFNGVRAGVAKGEFRQDDIAVNFFVLQNAETNCNPIKFGKFGKIYGENENLTLEDLFDQFEIDLDEMMGL